MPKERLLQYAFLMRLNKPIGTFLLLWPTLTALWIAYQGFPPLKMLFIFITGVFIMRAAGCVLNDLADRKFDRHVKRTQQRPLAAGKITVKNALILCFFLLMIAFCLVLMLNRTAFYIAVAGVILTASYPFFKRITHFPQVVLGITFNLGILMAFAVYQFSIAAWILYFTILLWTIMYDTQYAMADREEDLKIGIKSTAILFGNCDQWMIAILQGVVLLLLGIMGFILDFNFIYYSSLIIIAILFLYQQYLIRNRVEDHCFAAFKTNGYALFALFIGVYVQYLLLKLL